MYRKPLTFLQVHHKCFLFSGDMYLSGFLGMMVHKQTYHSLPEHLLI